MKSAQSKCDAGVAGTRLPLPSGLTDGTGSGLFVSCKAVDGNLGMSDGRRLVAWKSRAVDKSSSLSGTVGLNGGLPIYWTTEAMRPR